MTVKFAIFPTSTVDGWLRYGHEMARRAGLLVLAACLGVLRLAAASTGFPACDSGGTLATASDAASVASAIETADPGDCIRITGTISMTPSGLGSATYTFGAGSKNVILSGFSTTSVIFDITNMNVTFNNITIG